MVGISEPEYTVHPNDIMMMFKANMIIVAQKDDTVNETVNAILALIKQNPSITYEDLTEKTGKSRRTISRIITELKTTGTIARVPELGDLKNVNLSKCSLYKICKIM